MDDFLMTKMVELLYGLDEHELRRLAYEALLISDGPDRQIEDRKPEVLPAAEEALKTLNTHYKEF